jgi:hypothetical protein
MFKRLRFSQTQIVFFFVAGIIVWGGYLLYATFFICHRLSCLRMREVNEWKLKEVYEEKPGEVFRGLYVAGDGNERLRVDVRDQIDAETADDYIRGKIAGMKALYENIRSPYPGLLSDEIVCDEGLKPIYSTITTYSGMEIEVIEGYLNDRLTFGSCTKDQIVYKGIKVLFSCAKQKQLYDMEFIAPIDSFPQEKVAAMVESIECR